MVSTAQGDVPFSDVPFDVNNIPEPIPPPKEVRDFFDLTAFYQQWINVGGLPILASAEVNPYALKEAAWVIWQMIGHRRDILKAIAQGRERLSVLSINESLGDLPEFEQSINSRISFFLASMRDVAWYGATAAEEVLFCSASDYCYSFLIHEFAHAIHIWGLDTVDPTFDNRLKIAYNAAMNKGLWQDTYAASNKEEYWAEGVGSWFNAAYFLNPVQTRDALKTYDPSLALLIAEIFGNGDWRYTPPAIRLHLPHLQGFNWEEAFRLEGPPAWAIRQQELEGQLWDPDSDGDGKWVNIRLYHPSQLPTLIESTTRGGDTNIIFVNLTGNQISFYFVDTDGTENFQQTGTTTQKIAQFDTYAGVIWLIKDHNGDDLALFRAEEKVGRVFVTPTVHLITPGLSIVSGDNQSGLSGAVLANPFVIEVRAENLSPLEGVSVTFTVIAGDGALSVTHATTDENGQAEGALTLGQNEGTTTVKVAAAGIGSQVTFTAGAVAAVDIPNPNLRAVIETTLGVVSGTPILPSKMDTVTRLDAPNASISDLTGLQRATNLTFLNLGAEWVQGQGWMNNNSVSDLSPLAGLTKPTELLLHYNDITDISPVVGLTNLTFLWLEGNNITDISAVAGLTNLTRLDFGRNSISDISAIAGLTNVTSLWLWGNKISDITAATDLSNLTKIGLWDNKISDLSPLVANTGLGAGDTVYVQSNPLSYQSIHAHIPALQKRGVDVQLDPSITRPPDLNNDGSVNVLDLVMIANELGTVGQNLAADVNADGVINILDITLVASMFDNAAAAN